MNSRERVLTVLDGGVPDRAPVLEWADLAGGDLSFRSDSSRYCIAPVLSPFGRAISEGTDLNQLFRADPEDAQRRLAELTEAVWSDVAEARQRGADGILYALAGATPEHCSPMQYGGLYLEEDRAILERLASEFAVFVFILGEHDPYLDFVSDLPGSVFGWNSESTGIDSAAVRTLRAGPQLSQDPGSEFALVGEALDLPHFATHKVGYAV